MEITEHKPFKYCHNRSVLFDAAIENKLWEQCSNQVFKDVLKQSHLDDALCTALMHNSTECAKWLLESGASPSNFSRFSIVNLVKRYNHELIELLMPKLNQECKDQILEEAASHNFNIMVQYAIQEGAKDPLGRAFVTAAERGDIEIMNLIYDSCKPPVASVNEALIRALHYRYLYAAEYLLAVCGANINYMCGLGLEIATAVAVETKDQAFLEKMMPFVDKTTFANYVEHKTLEKNNCVKVPLIEDC